MWHLLDNPKQFYKLLLLSTTVFNSTTYKLICEENKIICDVGGWLSSRVLALHSVITGLISSRGDHGIPCWWDLIRSKQLFSVSTCSAQVFAGFSGHGNSIRDSENCQHQLFWFMMNFFFNSVFFPVTRLFYGHYPCLFSHHCWFVIVFFSTGMWLKGRVLFF